MARVREIDDTSITEDPPQSESSDQNQPAKDPKPPKNAFFPSLTNYTTPEWEALMLYVYRMAPITDRLASGSTTKFIAKYAEPIDEDRLKVEHGSGKYRVLLNQIDGKGHSKTIRQVECDIEDPKFPPQVPDGDWVDDPRNKRWAWARKKVEPEAAPPAQTAQASTLEIVKQVRELVKEFMPAAPKEDKENVTKAVLDAIKDTRKEMADAADPSKTVAMITSLINTFAPKGTDPLITLLMAQNQTALEEAREARKEASAERQRMHELQLKALEKKEEDGSPISRFKELLDLKELLAGEDGPRRAQSLGQQALEMVGPHVPILATAIASLFKPQPLPAGGGVQPQTIDTTAQPVTQQAQQQEQPPVSNDPLDELRKTLTQYAQFVWNKFSSWVNSEGQQLGSTGYDFAQLLVTVAGKPEYDRIRNLGAENIIAAFNTTPALQSHFAGLQPQLAEWIADFVAFGDPEEEPPVEETPTPVKGGRKK